MTDEQFANLMVSLVSAGLILDGIFERRLFCVGLAFVVFFGSYIVRGRVY